MTKIKIQTSINESKYVQEFKIKEKNYMNRTYCMVYNMIHDEFIQKDWHKHFLQFFYDSVWAENEVKCWTFPTF